MAHEAQASGDRFWLLVGNTPDGPFDVATIRARLAAGTATGQALACPVGGKAWVPLAQVPGSGGEIAMQGLVRQLFHPFTSGASAVKTQDDGSPDTPARWRADQADAAAFQAVAGPRGDGLGTTAACACRRPNPGPPGQAIPEKVQVPPGDAAGPEGGRSARPVPRGRDGSVLEADGEAVNASREARPSPAESAAQYGAALDHSGITALRSSTAQPPPWQVSDGVGPS